MAPSSIGVVITPSMTKQMFMAPTSSMYFRSRASSHRTSLQFFSCASRLASRLAA